MARQRPRAGKDHRPGNVARPAPQLRLDEIGDAHQEQADRRHRAAQVGDAEKEIFSRRANSQAPSVAPASPPWNDMPPFQTAEFPADSREKRADCRTAHSRCGRRARRRKRHRPADRRGFRREAAGRRPTARRCARAAWRSASPRPARRYSPSRTSGSATVRSRSAPNGSRIGDHERHRGSRGAVWPKSKASPAWVFWRRLMRRHRRGVNRSCGLFVTAPCGVRRSGDAPGCFT